MGQQVQGPRSTDDGLDDKEMLAFVVGFVDGLRDRVTPRDYPTSWHAEDVADHG